MRSPIGCDSRKAPRYFLLTPLPATMNGRNADVIDLSVHGARLQLTERLTPGAELPFSIESMATTATVLWCELAAISLMDDDDDDRYYCGVMFERPLPAVAQLIEDLIAEKSAVPMEETRNSERYRVTARVPAMFDGLTSARVLDISPRGVRLGTARLLTVGTISPLRFRIVGRDTPFDIRATVVWSRPAERIGRFEAGLRIEAGEESMRTVIEELSLRNEVTVETNTLDRKFNPLVANPVSGLLGVLR
jgi:hypothetical protein